MDFRPYIVVQKQPVAKSVTFEISDDKKTITIHDIEKLEETKSRPSIKVKQPNESSTESIQKTRRGTTDMIQPTIVHIDKPQQPKADPIIKRGLGAWHSFNVEKVFQMEPGSEFNRTPLYNECVDELVGKALANQSNGLIILHGQKTSGRSSTLYGPGPKSAHTGIMYQAVENLIKKTQTGFITDSGTRIPGLDKISLSIFDIHLEYVKDFGRNVAANMHIKEADMQFKDDQDIDQVTISEPLEGQDCIPVIPINGTPVELEIRSAEQFNSIITREGVLRKKIQALDEVKGIVRSQCQTIYVLNLKHKNSQHYTYLFFVKLRASDSTRLNLHHAHQFKSLEQFFSDLTKIDVPLPKIDTKLTNMLAGILTNRDKPVIVTFIAHVNLLAINFEETILTLQYQERIKNSLITEGTKVKQEGWYAEHVELIDRLFKKAQKDNGALRSQYEELINDQNEQFEELKKKLGLEYPIHVLLGTKPNTKESNYLTLHKDVKDRNRNINGINSDLKQKIQSAQNEQEASTKSLNAFKNKCDAQLQILEEQYNELNTLHQSMLSQLSHSKSSTQTQTQDEAAHILQHGRKLISDKASVILTMKDELRRTTEHFNKVTEMSAIGQREAELRFKERLYQVQSQHEENKNNMEEQYKHLIGQKDEELRKFKLEAENYIKTKKAEMKDAKKEIVGMYEVVKRQKETIENLEHGKFDNGIKSYNIPKEDKPLQPNRENFPFMYKSLEKSKVLVTSTNNNTLLRSYELKQTASQASLNHLSLQSPHARSTQSFTLGNKHKNSVNFQTFNPQKNVDSIDKSTSQQHDLPDFKSISAKDIDRMPLDDLKRIAKSLQQHLHLCNTTDPLNPKGIRDEKLKDLLNEREKYRKQLNQETKQLQEAQERYEMEKRLKNEHFNPNKTMQIGVRSLGATQSHQALLNKQLTKNSSVKSAVMSRPITAGGALISASHALLSNNNSRV